MTLPVVVGVGEVLWDLFESGPRLGGAPANFACHASSLGAEVFLVSAVGDDKLGRGAIQGLASRGIDTRHVQSTAFPTGTVGVTIGADGEPEYEITEGAAWDHVQWNNRLLELAKRADVVCFGTLSQRSLDSQETLIRLLDATGEDALRIVDINLRAPWFGKETVLGSLEMANVLKLNTAELPIVLKAAGIAGERTEAINELSRRFRLKLIALTDGPNGSQLFAAGESHFQESTVVEVRDTVGAGDAFTACLAIGMLRGLSLAQVGEHANSVAGWVCSEEGATPKLPEELVENFLK